MTKALSKFLKSEQLQKDTVHKYYPYLVRQLNKKAVN